jgi:ECF transporter S component (folate family)
MHNKPDIRRMVVLSMLIAADIILARVLTVPMWNMRFALSFIPVVIAAVVYGTGGAMIVGGLSDIIGALLIPSGTYFPGFTFTAVLIAFLYAFMLKKRSDIIGIIACVLTVQITGTLLLNTLWISILYSSPFLPLLITRLVQAGIMSVVQVVTIYALLTRGKHMLEFIGKENK